jgi:hypothetical protein
VQPILDRDLLRAPRKLPWISTTPQKLSALTLALFLVAGSIGVFSPNARALAMQSLRQTSAIATRALDSFTARSNNSELAAAAASAFDAFRNWVGNFLFPNQLTYTSATSPTTTNPPLAAVRPTTTAAAQTSPATTTIIQQYITNPVVERIIERATPQTETVSSVFLPLLTDFENRITGRLASVSPPSFTSFSGPAASTPISTAAFVPSQCIDQITNTAINNPTITGGTVSNIAVNGVSGLTASDIPTNVVASNYLPLSGGTLTGDVTGSDLTLSGNLTVAGAQTLSGAITVPYLTATTSTASLFNGGFLSLASSTIGNGTRAGGLADAATSPLPDPRSASGEAARAAPRSCA